MCSRNSMARTKQTHRVFRGKEYEQWKKQQQQQQRKKAEEMRMKLVEKRKRDLMEKQQKKIKERESVTPNKRARSMYQNFVYKCGPKIKFNLMEKSTTGRLKAGEFQKHCGRIWKSLSEESKEKYRPAAGMCDVSIAFIICSPLTIMCSALCVQYVLSIMCSICDHHYVLNMWSLL